MFAVFDDHFSLFIIIDPDSLAASEVRVGFQAYLCFEICLLVCAVAVKCLLLHLLSFSGPVHQNMTRIAQAFTVLESIQNLGQALLILVQLKLLPLNQNLVLDGVCVFVSVARSAMFVSRTGLLIIATIERAFALHFIKTYEKQSRSWIWLSCVLFLYVSTFAYGAVQHRLRQGFGIAVLIGSLTTCSLLAFLSTACFVYLRRQHQKYKVWTQDNNAFEYYNLSYRFQLEENDRVFEFFLIIFMTTSLVTAALLVLGFINMCFLSRMGEYGYLAVIATIDLVFAGGDMLCYVVYLCKKPIYHDYIASKFFGCCVEEFETKPKPQVDNAAVYFKHLQETWA